MFGTCSKTDCFFNEKNRAHRKTLGITGRGRVADSYHLVEVGALTAPRSGQATELQRKKQGKASNWG